MLTKKFPTFKTWPRLKNRQPIFKDSAAALFYAQLICNNLDEQKMLEIFRRSCYVKLKSVREQKKPDPNRMFSLAVQAQLFRECIEECTRISNEPYTFTLEGPPSKGA